MSPIPPKLMPPKPPVFTKLAKPKDFKTGVVKKQNPSAYDSTGIANAKKYIISTSFSTDGTVKNRESGDYGTFYGGVGGGVPDSFRDATGKYWTFTDNQQDVFFLNPYEAGNYSQDSKLAKSYIPAKIYYKKPELIEGKVWAEYEQKMYVTPDKDWIYRAFGESFFQKTTKSIKQILGINEQTEIDHNFMSELNLEQAVIIGVQAELQNQADQFKTMLKSWWYNKMGVDLETIYGQTGQTDPTKAGCQTLAAQSGLVNNANDKGTVADEICTPWIRTDVSYFDHVIDSFCPIEQNKNDQNQTNLGVKFPYYSLVSEYNFFIKTYERVLEKDNIIDEKILPNMYVFAASFLPEAVTGELSDYPKYQKIISLDGLLKDFDAEALKINDDDILQANNLKNPPVSAKQYFTYWSNKVDETIRINPAKIQGIQANVTSKQNFVFYPMQDTDILNNYNDQKFMFPMYNELEFSTGVTNVMGDMLRNTATSNHFMSYYTMFADNKFKELVDPSFTPGQPNIASQLGAFIEVNKQINLDQTIGTTKVIGSKVQVEQKAVEVTSVDGFLAFLGLQEILFGKYGPTTNFDYTQEQIKTIEQLVASSVNVFTANSIFVSKDENEQFLLANPSSKMQKSMLSMILYGKLRKLEKQYHRSFAQLMGGDANYSEVVMYMVTKRRVGEGEASGEISDSIQNYYFLNSSEIDVLTFIDTQVDYDAEYLYDIDAIVLSIGTKYEYTKSQLVIDRVRAFVESIGENGQTVLEKVPPTDYQEVLDYTTALDQGNVSYIPEPKPSDEFKDEGGLDINLDAEPTNQLGQPLQEEEESTGVINPSILDFATTVGTTTDLAQGRGVGALEKELLDFKAEQIDPDNLFNPERVFDNLVSDSQVIPDIKLVEGNSLTAEVTVRYKPDYKLLKTRYASVSGRVLDKPPVFPDALITPYKGTNNKLLVTLNQNVGEYYMKPIFITADDSTQYEKQLDAQKITANGADGTPAIEYKSDDPVGAGGYFEVYRLDKKPASYFDFRDNLLTTIDGYHESEVGHLESNAAALRDDIKPNRKYYYMFRVVDVHGHTSNPSPVFEVEMVDDGGTVYLIQNIVELEEPDVKKVGKSLKKYLQIKPTFPQAVLNVPPSDSPIPSAFDYGEDGDSGDIRLGTVETGLWGKKFKIRITSRSSGKQIDLNVTFTRTEDSSVTKNTEGKYYSKPRP